MLHSLRFCCLALISFLLLSANGNLVYASCEKVGTAIVFNGGSNPVNENGSPSDQCGDIPDVYLVTFFKIGLCRSNPAAGAIVGGSPDFSSCSFIYNGGALNHEITVPATTALATGQFSITPGVYPFMVATFSNKLGIKNTITFNNDVQGLGGTSGPACWTSGGLTTFHNEVFSTAHGLATIGKTIECGAVEAAAPEFNFEVLTHFDGPNDSCIDFTAGDGAEFDNGGFFQPASGGFDETTARVLKSDGSYADGCSNSARMLWVMKLASPASISPTSQFRLDFKLTDSVSIDFDSSDASIVKMGNDPFQMRFSATP